MKIWPLSLLLLNIALEFLTNTMKEKKGGWEGKI